MWAYVVLLVTLAVAVQMAWVTVTILVMGETSRTIVLVDMAAVLMALMSLVMMVVIEEVVVGGAMAGVAVTRADRRKLCSGSSSNCIGGDIYKGWKSQESTSIFWTHEGRDLEAEGLALWYGGS